MRRARSARSVITWTVILTTVAAAMIILWNVVVVQDQILIQELARRAASAQEVGFRWVTYPLGIVLALTVLIGLLVMGIRLVREVDFSQKQSDFIAGVTHEFKSPLSAIRLSAETLLTRDMPPEDQRRFLLGILDEAERLNRLVNNVLAAGKIDLQRLDKDAKPTALGDLLTDYHGERRRAMENQAVDWHLDVRDSDEVLVDEVMLRVVLDNLVDNAVKYSGPPKWVKISCNLEPEWAVLRVEDHGIGIADADREMLFERFYRGHHQPKRRVPGSGLGLFLVHHLVQAHRGQLTLVSEGEGQGTCAEVRFPRGTPQK